MSKVAIIILADIATPENFGRAVNGLMTAKEFKDAGDDVQIIFDGAGTKWIGKFNEKDGKYNALFDSVKAKLLVFVVTALVLLKWQMRLLASKYLC